MPMAANSNEPLVIATTEVSCYAAADDRKIASRTNVAAINDASVVHDCVPLKRRLAATARHAVVVASAPTRTRLHPTRTSHESAVSHLFICHCVQFKPRQVRSTF